MVLRECARRPLSIANIGSLVSLTGLVDGKATARAQAEAATELFRKGLASLWVEDHCVDATGESVAALVGSGRQITEPLTELGAVVLCPTEAGRAAVE